MADLKHELKARHLFALAFGTIVGVGWITVLGHWLAGGSLGAIVAFAVGGLLMLTIGLCYAEVGSMMPASGGEVVYAERTFGPAAGFAAGWVLCLIYISVTAFEAISVGWIVTVLLPELDGPVIYRAFGANVTLGSLCIGLAGMILIAYLNYRGARDAAAFQNLMTFGLIVVSLVFIAVGLTRGDTDHLQPLFAASDFSGAVAGMTAVFIMTPFFFAGFNVLPQALGERSPDVSLRTVSVLILLSILGALIFYVLVILASSMTLPRAELLQFDLPAAAAFRAAFDSVLLGNIVLFAGLLGLITTWNAVFFGGVRVLLALSRSGALPARLGAIDAVHGTPVGAVLLVAAVGTVLMLFGRGAIGLIVNTLGVCFALLFLTVAVILIYLRLREPSRERPYRVPGGLILPSVAALSALGMIVVSLREHLLSTGGFPAEWTVLIVWTILGIGFWFASASRRRRVNPAAERHPLLDAGGGD